MSPTDKKLGRTAWYGALLTLPILMLVIFFWNNKQQEDKMHAIYTKIAVGMDLPSVEQLLGPGKKLTEGEVTQTSTGPVVKGDKYYEWTDKHRRKIILSFVDNRVREKWYNEMDL